MEMMIKVIARFVDKKTKKPLSAKDLVARLYDNDAVGDDFIGESGLDENGRAEVVASLSAARSADSPFEKHPDLYFSLLKQNEIIFESTVFKNVDFTSKGKSSREHHSSRDLGTFEV